VLHREEEFIPVDGARYLAERIPDARAGFDVLGHVAIANKVRALDIELRAGLHTGECELVGDDIGGIAVNIGARIGALAGADEVVVSSTVKDLVVGSGISFVDRGARKLKGVPGEWRLFAVDQVEAPPTSRLVPDTRERGLSYTDS
jgi:class 3 adenylate cyclase